jgi:hypothetical protein
MRWLLLLAACGGKQPKMVEHVESDPAWAKSYETRAAAGCECKDAPCLDKAHVELAKFESDHGGMDEMPPGVQKAHGEFDRCWREGTKDPARDMAFAADEVCACTDSKCLTQFEITEMHLTGKYEVTDITDVAAMAPGAKDALARANKCVDDDTIPAEKFLAIEQKATDDICQCENLGCAQAVMRARSESFGNFLRVSDLPVVQEKLDQLTEKFCKCLGEMVTREASGSLMDPFPMKIDATIHCK